MRTAFVCVFALLASALAQDAASERTVGAEAGEGSAGEVAAAELEPLTALADGGDGDDTPEQQQQLRREQADDGQPDALAATSAGTHATQAAESNPPAEACPSTAEPTGLRRRRVSALTPRSIYRRTVGFYAGCTAVLMPLWEPKHVASLLSALRLPEPVSAVLLSACSGVYNMRQQHMLPCLLAHEVITDVSADITAQTFEVDQALPANKAAAAAGAANLVSLDWGRVLRSTSVSLISDDFPFLLWSRGLWIFTERLVKRLRAAKGLPPRLVSVLTHGLTISVGKMVVTQLLYESTSNALYLSLQAVFRGMGWRGVKAELRAKFVKCWLDGVVFWSAAHVVVFAMPFWWLQPIVDNTFTLFFNTCARTLARCAPQPSGRPLVRLPHAPVRARSCLRLQTLRCLRTPRRVAINDSQPGGQRQP